MSSLALARGFGIATACLFGMLGAAAVNSACTLQLDISIACGDGYVDLEAGEECDPDDPDRAFESACGDIGRPQGTAQCDAATCEIENSFQICAFCGDGMIDGEEQCEGSNLNGQVCPGDAGTLQCKDCKYDYSACQTCGDGDDDDVGEECDPSSLNLAMPQLCAGDSE